jgi:AbrB family looped-hinge helix DNA binding protein
MSTISTITVGNKGRVVVPKSIRDEVGLFQGVRVSAFVDDLGRVVLETPDAIKTRIRRRASLARDISGDAVSQLMDERRRDASLLDTAQGDED